MCESCGCGVDADVVVAEHGHQHPHIAGRGNTVRLEERVLAKNDRLAAANRRWLAEHEVRAVNLMGSPGSGKTTLLERTVRELAGELSLGVVEGDQATPLDAERIEAAGGRAVQINTGSGCHLDAAMVAHALALLDPPARSLVLVENVGNLVCPALFDLGQQATVVLASVTEGADKPLKYPHMFRAADLVVVNKTDLLPYVDFPVEEFFGNVRAVRPRALHIRLSATSGEGFDQWADWLRRGTSSARSG